MRNNGEYHIIRNDVIVLDLYVHLSSIMNSKGKYHTSSQARAGAGGFKQRLTTSKPYVLHQVVLMKRFWLFLSHTNLSITNLLFVLLTLLLFNELSCDKNCDNITISIKMQASRL